MPLKSRSGRSKSRSGKSRSGKSRSRSRSLRGGTSGEQLPVNSLDGGQADADEEDDLTTGGTPSTIENFGKMWGGRSGRRRGKSGRRTGRRGGRSGSSDGAGMSDGGGGGSSKGGRRKDGGVKSRRRHAKGGFVGLVQDALVPLGLLWMQNRSKNKKGHKLMGGKRHKTRKSRGGDDIA
jgi:hypothetical protein